MTKLSLTVLFFLLALVSLHAQEPNGGEQQYPIDSLLEECLSIEANQSTQGMIECLRTAQDSWDAEMNRSYKELMKNLDSAGQNALREAQRAWIKYRDAEIELCVGVYYYNLDGTMYHVTAGDRVMQIIRERALELQAYLDALTEFSK